MNVALRRVGTVVALSVTLTLALPLAVAVAPAAHGSTADPMIGDRSTRVLVVGDSVLEGAATTIPGALPWREVVVDTEVSRSTSRSVDAALAHGTDWDVVVVLLGHNDGASPSAYQPAFRRLFDAFAGSPRIVALTIHEVRPYYPTVNAFLRDEAALRPNLRILDWNAVATAHPDATAGDGLHLSPSGSTLVANEIAAQVEAAEVELAPTTTTAPATTSPPTPSTTTAPATTADEAATSTTVTPTTSAPPAPDGPSRPASGAAADALVVSSTPTEDPRLANRRSHTPPWAWPGVLAGAVALATLLFTENRRRRIEPDPPPSAT